MQSIEWHVENADSLAQKVVNAWGKNLEAGNGLLLSHKFKVLLDKACQYRDAKNLANNHRKFAILSERDASKEESTRRRFAHAYRDFVEKKSSPISVSKAAWGPTSLFSLQGNQQTGVFVRPRPGACHLKFASWLLWSCSRACAHTYI